jgi:DNA-binding response OmpR family regulator
MVDGSEANQMSKRIMVVDDEAALRSVLDIRLRAAGYAVSSAADAKTALELLEQQGPPDLFIIDLMMPHMNGWQLCKEIRAQERWKHVPIIVLSALLQGDTASNAPNEGDFLMAKPYEPSMLMAKIREFIG